MRFMGHDIDTLKLTPAFIQQLRHSKPALAKVLEENNVLKACVVRSDHRIKIVFPTLATVDTSACDHELDRQVDSILPCIVLDRGPLDDTYFEPEEAK